MRTDENNQSPRVSVVVATRNRLQWLQQCVKSIDTQQGVSWELIVIDDASTDLTAPWLKEISNNRVRSYRFEQNCERCRARNQGLSMVRGEYVMFLDDDDRLRPDSLRLLANALDENPGAVVAVGARHAVFTGEDYERRDAHPRRQLKRNIQNELIFGWNAVPGQNLFRTPAVRSIGGFEDESVIPCEDRLLMQSVAALGSAVLVPEEVMDYRYHDGQTRPADIRSLRNRVARRTIRRMPKESRRKALGIRHSGHLIEQVEEQLSHGNPFTGVGPFCKAVIISPAIFTSPLIGEWVVRRLAGRLYRRMFPVVKTS